jgi:hypothetical protein
MSSKHVVAEPEVGANRIESIPRRGAVEHVYRGKSRIYFTDEEFEEMPLEQRSKLSTISVQSLVARVDTAIRTKTFDARADRHATWRQLPLDERGWKEAMETLAACYGEIERIRHDALDRLAASGEQVVTTTIGMLGFKSPPPPPLPLPAKD